MLRHHPRRNSTRDSDLLEARLPRMQLVSLHPSSLQRVSPARHGGRRAAPASPTPAVGARARAGKFLRSRLGTALACERGLRAAARQGQAWLLPPPEYPRWSGSVRWGLYPPSALCQLVPARSWAGARASRNPRGRPRAVG